MYVYVQFICVVVLQMCIRCVVIAVAFHVLLGTVAWGGGGT